MVIESLLSTLRSIGISSGDILCVSSDVGRIGIPDDVKSEVKSKGIGFLLDSYIDTLLHAVGDSGTVFLPTFTYSGCKNEPFKPLETKSTVGLLSEHFRKHPRAIRSHHPIFSFSGIGPRVKEIFLEVGADSFGPKSLYGLLYDLNAKYLLLGLGMGKGATYVYFSEQKAKVPYRYFKDFTCTIETPDAKTVQVCSYYVRDLKLKYRDDWERLENDSIVEEITKSADFGGSLVLTHSAQMIDVLIQNKISQDPNYLIKLL